MNVHHLELFYYVAKHGGIASAVRRIPYGIQQPAVSAQIAKLEETLGVKLFNRRPFFLLPQGKELYEFIAPFFEGLEPIANEIRSRSAPCLRVAAPTLALHDYIPALLHRVRKKMPSFRVHLHDAGQPEAEQLLQDQEIDIAISIIDKKPKAGLHSKKLLEIPLVLLLHKKERFKSPDELWKADKIEKTLITFPETEIVYRNFQRGLKALGVEWFTGIEVNSAGLIECYVANEFGIGVSVGVPGAKINSQIRQIPLDDFPSVTIGAIWSGKLSEAASLFLSEVEKEAEAINRLR